MNKLTRITQLSPKFVLISRLSGGLSLTLSLIYTLLSIAYFIFRYNCSAGGATTKDGAKYFWHTIFRVYILSGNCSQRLTITRLTDETTVLILVSVALAFTVALAILAIILLSITQSEGLMQYADKIVYVYVGCFVASLVVDLTTASYFGLDYRYLSTLLKELSSGSPANYKLEVIRQGVFWLMTISLKGYVAYMINGVFVILLIAYIIEMRNSALDEHSIHKLGALSAFEFPHDTKSNQALLCGTAFYTYKTQEEKKPCRPQPKNTFIEVNTSSPHSGRRPDPHRYEHSSTRSFDRSDSWHHSHNNPSQNSSRPFSYLEEVKRPMHQKMPSPVSFKDTSWRRDMWTQPGPPVPAPDYSPDQPRKLKSALKPPFM